MNTIVLSVKTSISQIDSAEVVNLSQWIYKSKAEKLYGA